MTSSITNARSADLDSTNDVHVFPWKWNLTDLENVPKNGLNVFSCFACGGGSSMGYKLAGYNVIGNCEIDRPIYEMYKKNHHPKYSYLMDVRDFLKLPDDELPEELFNLDVLDGSPPCSVFSMAGEREGGWQKEKVFREGQKKQTLDDLFFVFIDIVRKLKPKVVIAENVKGLIAGNAKGYVNEIFKRFRNVGYDTQLFLLNSAKMGVPQSRERVFFVSRREDMNLEKIDLKFNEKVITFGEIRSKRGVKVKEGTIDYKLLQQRKSGDSCIADISMRVRNKNSGFARGILSDNKVSSTIVSGGNYYRMYDGEFLSKEDFIHIQTFPQDYDFMGQKPQYVCGMSVPPVMMAQIARQVYLQWFSKLK